MEKKRINIPNISDPIIHVLGWLLIFGFPLIMISRNASNFSWWDVLNRLDTPIYLFVIFYINYLVLIPRFFMNGRQKLFILLNILLCVLVNLCSYYYWHLFHNQMVEMMAQHQVQAPPPPRNPMRGFGPPSRWLFLIRDVAFQLLTIIIAAAVRLSKEWRKAERARKEAELGRTEAELKNLRSQINPHFLLNTLNNIYALIQFDQDKAQKSVQDLSKLLRHMLYDSREMYTPLSSEIAFLNNYVNLMKIRLPETTQVEVNLDVPQANAIQVAPLLYISLVENAFKHGVRTSGEECFIRLGMQLQNESLLTFSIENSNYPKTEQDRSGSGIGLEQVQQRLNLTYPNRYKWTKGVQGNTYSSVLTIETNHQKTIS